MAQTYNVYAKANAFRKTNLTRIEAIEHYQYLKTIVPIKDIIIYCSTRDFYVKGQGIKNSFLNDFLDLNSKLAYLHYDESSMLLENTRRGLKYNHKGRIVFVKNNILDYIN